jgi:hypothetical protein
MTRSRKKPESFREIRARLKKLKVELEAGRWLTIVSDNKTPVSRLRELAATLQYREIEKQDAGIQEALLSEMEKTIPDILHKYHELFLFNYFCEVMRIDEKSSFDGPICDAFAEAKLDPEQLFHWRLLLTILCWSVFPPTRLPRHEAVWDGNLYFQLLKEFHTLRFTEGRRRRRSDTEISKLLFERGAYEQKERTIVRYFQEACDPRHNKTLADFVRRGTKSITERYQSRGLSWPPADLECLLKRIRKLSPSEDISSAAQSNKTLADSKSAFQLFNKLRSRNHRNLEQAMRRKKLETRQVAEFLDSRRTNDESALLDVLSPVPDYDAFMKLLDLTLEKDQTAFAIYALTEATALGEDRPFKALEDMREKDIEKIDKAVAEYYCDRIANGLIDPSEASEGV